jgi:hypothetical protein
MTAFPWLVSGESDRRFCQAATEHGILLAPGLLRCALAFPPGLRRRQRQFLQGARPFRSVREELVGEDGDCVMALAEVTIAIGAAP